MKMLLGKLHEWQQKGYVSANVWESMEEVVDPNILPVRKVPSSGQGEPESTIPPGAHSKDKRFSIECSILVNSANPHTSKGKGAHLSLRRILDPPLPT